jgi:hypothetical protein
MLIAQNVFPPNGNVGIATNTPSQQLMLGSGNLLLPNANLGSSGNLYLGGVTHAGQTGLRLFGGLVNGSAPAGFIDVRTTAAGDGLRIRVDTGDGGTERVRVTANGNVGIGTNTPAARLDVAGTTRTGVLEITGGSDIAEPFRLSNTAPVKDGILLAIDSERPGHLKIADKAYDRTVAGIVSGANGLNPGLMMTQQGTAVAEGSVALALAGRVYCMADASDGPIVPGDLLTTSDVPGHAMKVTDHARAHGAIIGKAMSPLSSGRGFVLVLVALQ